MKKNCRMSRRDPARPQPPPHRPYALSTATTGPLLEDVWPTIFFGEEAVAEISRKAQTLSWAREAVAQMRQEAETVILRPPQLPVAKAGWRHDFYSRATAEHLHYDAASPDRFLDPWSGKFEADPAPPPPP